MKFNNQAQFNPLKFLKEIAKELKIYEDGNSEVEIIPCRQTNYTIQYLETEEAQKAFFDYFQSISADKVLG